METGWEKRLSNCTDEQLQKVKMGDVFSYVLSNDITGVPEYLFCKVYEKIRHKWDKYIVGFYGSIYDTDKCYQSYTYLDLYRMEPLDTTYEKKKWEYESKIHYYTQLLQNLEKIKRGEYE